MEKNISRDRANFIKEILAEFNHGDIRKVADKYLEERISQGKNISREGAYSTTQQTIIKLKDGFHGNTRIVELLKERAQANKELLLN